MLGQLGTPPANAACTLHRKKHLIIMISREATEGHIFCSLRGQYDKKNSFELLEKYKNHFIKVVNFFSHFS